jgi:hypothetical protein
MTPRLRSELGLGGRVTGVASAGRPGLPAIAPGLDGNHTRVSIGQWHPNPRVHDRTGESVAASQDIAPYRSAAPVQAADVHRAPPAREPSTSSPPTPCPGVRRQLSRREAKTEASETPLPPDFPMAVDMRRNSALALVRWPGISISGPMPTSPLTRPDA